MTGVLTAVLLAAPQPGDYDPSTGKGPEWGKAAPIGLLVILLLGVAVFFLLRSFTRQLKKVPATFDARTDSGPDSGTGAARAADVQPATRGPAAGRGDGDIAPPGDGPPTGPVGPTG